MGPVEAGAGPGRGIRPDGAAAHGEEGRWLPEATASPACRAATPLSCMHAVTPLSHACMRSRPSLMHACGHAPLRRAATPLSCMHAVTPLSHTCMRSSPSLMHACGHAPLSCMHAVKPLSHACMRSRPSQACSADLDFAVEERRLALEAAAEKEADLVARIESLEEQLRDSGKVRGVIKSGSLSHCAIETGMYGLTGTPLTWNEGASPHEPRTLLTPCTHPLNPRRMPRSRMPWPR